MLKDNEEIPLPMLSPDGRDSAAEPRPFAPDQMVACEHCLRTNPPTRVNCIYCGMALPTNEATSNLQKPTLRRLEKWELGYNNILLPSANARTAPGESDWSAAADLLKLAPADLVRIISCDLPLPLAHPATVEDAALVERRLAGLGIRTRIVSDADLGLNESGPFRARAMEFDETGLRAYQSADSEPVHVAWADLILIVRGRLILNRVEMKEQKTARSEGRILDSSEFFSDEVVLDLYGNTQPAALRVASNSFDFSCLGPEKVLISGENMKRLLETFRRQAPHAKVDDSYMSLRKVLEPVWPVKQQNESGGLRRERPGKYSIGSVIEKSNEMQFMRYSLLRHYLQMETRAGSE